MPIIRVEMFTGRTPDQKKALVEELTAAFCRAASGSPAAVQVVLTDVDKGDWGSGGQIASEKFPD